VSGNAFSTSGFRVRVKQKGGIVPVIGIDHVQLAMPAGGEELARRFIEMCWN
jgi:hypothetical protein